MTARHWFYFIRNWFSGRTDRRRQWRCSGLETFEPRCLLSISGNVIAIDPIDMPSSAETTDSSDETPSTTDNAASAESLIDSGDAGDSNFSTGREDSSDSAADGNADESVFRSTIEFFSSLGQSSTVSETEPQDSTPGQTDEQQSSASANRASNPIPSAVPLVRLPTLQLVSNTRQAELLTNLFLSLPVNPQPEIVPLATVASHESHGPLDVTLGISSPALANGLADADSRGTRSDQVEDQVKSVESDSQPAPTPTDLRRRDVVNSLFQSVNPMEQPVQTTSGNQNPPQVAGPEQSNPEPNASEPALIPMAVELRPESVLPLLLPSDNETLESPPLPESRQQLPLESRTSASETPRGLLFAGVLVGLLQPRRWRHRRNQRGQTNTAARRG